MSALPEEHPVKKELSSEFDRMRAIVPSLDGFSKLANVTAEISSLGGWAQVAFSDDGSIVKLEIEAGGRQQSWASPSSPLALLRYQTFVEADFEAWREEYIINGTGGENEYGMQSSFMNVRNFQRTSVRRENRSNRTTRVKLTHKAHQTYAHRTYVCA